MRVSHPDSGLDLETKILSTSLFIELIDPGHAPRERAPAQSQSRQGAWGVQRDDLVHFALMLLPCYSFSDARRDRYFIQLVLICLDH